ncbi:helix-turn-helix domain-containing protein [Streptomyces sp. NPDC008163]|uniref:helix-turn-helix domain-containing protein n=1 Tax=Streptomyces sp. NPDC008163 TaxID=3364818 RepID=UPI0036E62FAF
MTTSDQLLAQLRMLLEQTRMAPEKLGGLAGVSENTVRAMAKGSARFPQQSTLESLVRACGQDAKPWMDAWHRANEARVRPARISGTQDAQLQIDELTDSVRQLSEQVATLIELQTQQDQEQAHQVLSKRAYYRFLHALPRAEFQRVPWHLDAQGTSASPEQPSCDEVWVFELLEELGEMITDQGRLPELLNILSWFTPDLAGSRTPFEAGETAPNLVSKADVDHHLARIRDCLRGYFAEIGGEVPPRPGGQPTSA